MSDNFPVIIRELDGSASITLEGSRLPEQGVRVASEARLIYSWYPGRRSASVQVLGTKESPITFRGRLSDSLIGQPGAAAFYGEQLGELQARQRRLELTWGESLVRLGRLKRVELVLARAGIRLYDLEFWPDSAADARQLQPPREPATSSSDAIEALDRAQDAADALRVSYALATRIRGLSSTVRATL